VISLKKIVISICMVTVSMVIGVLLTFWFSHLLPKIYSSFDIFGAAISLIVTATVLFYYEFKSKERDPAITFLSIGGRLFFVSALIALLLQTSLNLMMLDSSMTSSLNGVMMRKDGALTSYGWVNAISFVITTGVNATLSGLCYVILKRGNQWGRSI
jgi:hypothetical protein